MVTAIFEFYRKILASVVQAEAATVMLSIVTHFTFNMRRHTDANTVDPYDKNAELSTNLLTKPRGK